MLVACQAVDVLQYPSYVQSAVLLHPSYVQSAVLLYLQAARSQR
jgi:hypothetical protein